MKSHLSIIKKVTYQKIGKSRITTYYTIDSAYEKRGEEAKKAAFLLKNCITAAALRARGIRKEADAQVRSQTAEIQ